MEFKKNIKKEFYYNIIIILEIIFFNLNII